MRKLAEEEKDKFENQFNLTGRTNEGMNMAGFTKQRDGSNAGSTDLPGQAGGRHQFSGPAGGRSLYERSAEVFFFFYASIFVS